jgi:hypothetical protein
VAERRDERCDVSEAVVLLVGDEDPQTMGRLGRDNGSSKCV